MKGDRGPLELIVKLGRLCQASVGDLSLDAFGADYDRVDAIAFRLQHVGEAVGRLSHALVERNPDVPWPAIIRMRNILAHAYEQIAPRVLWSVVHDDLPPLLTLCERELASKA